MKAIEFNSVTKRFGGQTALDSISFSVETGSVFAILGDNGAGKTTAIKAMLGFLNPNSGTIRVLDLDPSREDQKIRASVGYVSEQPDLYDWMRVDEIGWFTAGVRGGNYYQSYRDHLDRFQIPLGKKIRQLSKGMKAKVALALAIAHEPQLLILDEPTSGLDPLVRREFLESMVDVAATGATVFLSSHQINEVERVADTIAFLRQGELVFVEKLSDLKESTAELVVTFENESNHQIELPATTIQRQGTGRQQRFLIRDIESSDAIEARVNELNNVVSCQLYRPSLEEIFLGYLSGNQTNRGEQTEKAEATSA